MRLRPMTRDVLTPNEPSVVCRSNATTIYDTETYRALEWEGGSFYLSDGAILQLLNPDYETVCHRT